MPNNTDEEELQKIRQNIDQEEVKNSKDKKTKGSY